MDTCSKLIGVSYGTEVQYITVHGDIPGEDGACLRESIYLLPLLRTQIIFILWKPEQSEVFSRHLVQPVEGQPSVYLDNNLQLLVKDLLLFSAVREAKLKKKKKGVAPE